MPLTLPLSTLTTLRASCISNINTSDRSYDIMRDLKNQSASQTRGLGVNFFKLVSKIKQVCAAWYFLETIVFLRIWGHKPIKIQIIQTHILSSKVLKYYSKMQKNKTSISLIILASNSNVTPKKNQPDDGFLNTAQTMCALAFL